MTFGFISDETLLGYLLGALDDQELSIVNEALLRDKHLRVRLASLRSMALPLAGENELIEPPGSMVSRVMSQLSSDAENDCYGDARPQPTTPSNAENAALSSSAATSKVVYQSVWLDMGLSLTAAAIGLCLIAPAVVQSRETARSSQCASGLMRLGQQIRDFAFQNRQACVPEIPTEGPLAFAGLYAIHLNDTGRLEESQRLWCPSELNNRFAVIGARNRRLPSARELQAFSVARRRVWQHIAGGSYAYNLGIIVNYQHRMPTLDASSNVAILADAPIQSDRSGLKLTAHRGLASNVLYSDGRVQLMRFDHGYDGPDHPYLNRNGVTEAGIDRDDSALGASYLSPLRLPLNRGD